MFNGLDTINPEAKLIIQVSEMCIRQERQKIFPSAKEEELRQKVMYTVIDAFEKNDNSLFEGYKKPIYLDLINDPICI